MAFVSAGVVAPFHSINRINSAWLGQGSFRQPYVLPGFLVFFLASSKTASDGRTSYGDWRRYGDNGNRTASSGLGQQGSFLL